MSLRNNSIVPAVSEKVFVVNNSEENGNQIKFVLVLEQGVSNSVEKKYMTVRVRNNKIFYGHYSLIKLQFSVNKDKEISMRIKKCFLSVEEDIPDSDIQIDDGKNTINVPTVTEIYKKCFSFTPEKLSWICLLFDTGMVDETKFCSRRSELINKLFFRAPARFNDTFFSIITFGGQTESYLKIDNMFISDTTNRIMDSISQIELNLGGNVKCNPFDNLFKQFDDMKEFNLKYHPNLDVTFNIIMITDGDSFNENVIKGYCQARDELKVNVLNIGGDINNRIIKTLCNCNDWTEFFKKNRIELGR